MSLRVPLARSESLDNVVFPNVSKTDGPFSCINCSERLVLRQGAVRQYHFAHCSTSQCGGGEGILHRATKHWVCNSVKTASIIARCADCDAVHTVWHSNEACVAEEELACKVGGAIKYRIDVAVVGSDDGKLVASIEVFHTHRISAEKRAYLEQFAPVYEIRAVDPASTDFSTTFECVDQIGRCPKCAKLEQRREEERAYKRRLDELCRTLRTGNLMRAFLMRWRARTLVKRLRARPKCSCGRVSTSYEPGLNDFVAACSRCIVDCTKCDMLFHAEVCGEDGRNDFVCKYCLIKARLVPCRLCGSRNVYFEDTAYYTEKWHKYEEPGCTEYETACPGLCDDCSEERIHKISLKRGRSDKRPCAKCKAWGSMFKDVYPVRRPYENEYNKLYDWACNKCKVECTDCRVYCFDYGRRCYLCNQKRKRLASHE